MILLMLSIMILAAGPLLYRIVEWRQEALDLFEGFVLTSVGGLILLHALPPAVESAGALALVFGAVGMLSPLAIERIGGERGERAHVLVFGAALVGVFLHALLDGVTLAAQSHAETSTALALAVVVHRLPVALLVWWLIRPSKGRRAAAGGLVFIAAATVGGFLVEERLHGVMDGVGLALLQAFVAGSLLHVLLHHSPVRGHRHDHGAHGHDHGDALGSSNPALEALGALLGAALVLTLPLLEQLAPAAGHVHHHDHAHHHAGLVDLTGFGERLLHLTLESAPALLLGYLLAGAFAAFLPRASLGWIRRGAPASQAARGMVLGLPIPICSCGVVPLYQSLVRRGVPATAAMAFLIATPELGVEALILSVPLLGWEMTIARLIAAAVVALAVGWFVGRLVAPHERATTGGVGALALDASTLAERARVAARFGLREVVDDTAPWILVGLVIAALIAPDSLPGLLAGVPGVLEVALFALAGLPLYVCASGATPLAAALVAAGASPGAAVAMLLAGPATNVTTFGVLSELHGRRVAALFGGAVVTMAFLMGVSVDLVLGAGYDVPSMPGDHEAFGVLHWGSLTALAALTLASLFRKGPRRWINTVFNFGSHDHGDGGCGDDTACGASAAPSPCCSQDEPVVSPCRGGHDHDHGDDHARDHDLHGDETPRGADGDI